MFTLKFPSIAELIIIFSILLWFKLTSSEVDIRKLKKSSAMLWFTYSMLCKIVAGIINSEEITNSNHSQLRLIKNVYAHPKYRRTYTAAPNVALIEVWEYCFETFFSRKYYFRTVSVVIVIYTLLLFHQTFWQILFFYTIFWSVSNREILTV